MTDSAQTRPSFRIVRDGVPFIVCVDHQKIVFIRPEDTKSFKTPEGVAVGDNFMGVLSRFFHPLVMRPGWAYFIPLPSGWNVAFVASPKDPTAGRCMGTRRSSLFLRAIGRSDGSFGDA